MPCSPLGAGSVRGRWRAARRPKYRRMTQAPQAARCYWVLRPRHRSSTAIGNMAASASPTDRAGRCATPITPHPGGDPDRLSLAPSLTDTRRSELFAAFGPVPPVQAQGAEKSDLIQRTHYRFHLLEPVGHGHLAIHGPSNREVLLRLVVTVCAVIELAEAEVA